MRITITSLLVRAAPILRASTHDVVLHHRQETKPSATMDLAVARGLGGGADHIIPASQPAFRRSTRTIGERTAVAYAGHADHDRTYRGIVAGRSCFRRHPR